MNALITIEQPQARRSGSEPILTPALQAAFLGSLQLLGNVAIACTHAKISRMTAYRARRRSPAFARAWDAALLAARVHAEAELADRAINGVEEAVFYHGEEVARRRRYSDRLLLAHLARLDKMAERAELQADQARLDDWVDALTRGEELAAIIAAEGDFRAQSAACDTVAQPGQAAASAGDRVSSQYPVTGVTGSGPNARGGAGDVGGAGVEPCPDCGGRCLGATADLKLRLGPDDCQWFGNRLDRMVAARPTGAVANSTLFAHTQEWDEIDSVHIKAFEAGLPEWWCIAAWDELDAPLAAHAAASDGVTASGVGGTSRCGEGSGALNTPD